ncbi:MAG: WbqC family protein [bacterium]
MILAAEYPNYLPLVSFFYKMAQAEIFVLVDDFQFTKHNYINRTKIKTARGVQWLTVPVLTKGRKGQLIQQVQINVFQDWRRKHWKTLMVNYTYAAYFDKYSDFFESVFNKSWSYLLDLNLKIIEYIKNELHVPAKIYLGSELNIKGKGNQRLINLLEKLNCRTYLSFLDGKRYLDTQIFEKNGFEVEFISSKPILYHQQFGNFISNLSIVDLLFNEGENSTNLILGK